MPTDTPNILNYLTSEDICKIKDFSKDKATPFLVINLKKISDKYDVLSDLLPYAKIYYAVKANSHKSIIKLLSEKGSCFDVASIYELDLLLGLGISSDRISFGNTIKKSSDIKYAYNKGIRLFVTDSFDDVAKLAENAPGARVVFRILFECEGADWPLSKKFGAHPDLLFSLILEANKKGLIPYGLSFHVGSQQRDVGQWDRAISQCKYLFDAVKAEGIQLKLINLGGGFPAHYLKSTHKIEVYTNEIDRRLHEDFGNALPEIMIEPGRSLVADAGVIVTEVVMVSKKSFLDQHDWLYLDCGIYNGLFEAMNELIKYPVFLELADCQTNIKEFIIAGPTCDSMDILYINNKYSLSAEIKDKDRIYILSTGAYADICSSVGFNGFPPLKAYILDED